MRNVAVFVFVASCLASGIVMAQDAVRESNGRSGSGGGTAPRTRNASCDIAEARKCQQAAAHKLSLCDYSLLNHCKSEIMADYLICKQDAARCN